MKNRPTKSVRAKFPNETDINAELAKQGVRDEAAHAALNALQNRVDAEVEPIHQAAGTEGEATSEDGTDDATENSEDRASEPERPDESP